MLFWVLVNHNRHLAPVQTYNNCAETHHGGGVLSPFVFPLSAIAQPICHWQHSSQERPMKILTTCHPKTHPGFKVVSAAIIFLFSFLPPLLTWLEQHGYHVKYALTGTSRQLATYNYTGSLVPLNDTWVQSVDANKVCPGIHKDRVRSATKSAVVGGSNLNKSGRSTQKFPELN